MEPRIIITPKIESPTICNNSWRKQEHIKNDINKIFFGQWVRNQARDWKLTLFLIFSIKCSILEELQCWFISNITQACGRSGALYSARSEVPASRRKGKTFLWTLEKSFLFLFLSYFSKLKNDISMH